MHKVSLREKGARPVGMGDARAGISLRGIIATSLALGLGVLGFWLGEGGWQPWDLALIGAGAVGAAGVGAAAPTQILKKIALGCSALILFGSSWFAGARSFANAYNDCVAKGEEVRSLLQAHYRETHIYPSALGELETVMPCGRVLRPSLLSYERTADGYRLSFADRLVEHTATETEPFLPRK